MNRLGKSHLLTLLVGLIIGAVALGAIQAAMHSSTDVRVGVKRLADGRVEVKVQQLDDEQGWHDLELPPARFLELNVPVDAWRYTNPIPVSVAEEEAEVIIQRQPPLMCVLGHGYPEDDRFWRWTLAGSAVAGYQFGVRFVHYGALDSDEHAADLRDRELKLTQRISELEEDLDQQRERDSTDVLAEDIAEVVSMWTGIPLVQIATEESERLLRMEEDLHERIVGQEEPIVALAKAVRRARAGLKDPRRPIGVFMFLGPTGVGKTELARALADFMFGSDDNMVRLDMSEFMERHTVARLVGAPPGYVGYDDGGQLTDTVRRKSYCLILLDEIEKAHPEVFNMLLQVFDDGHLTDAKGRRVDFRNTIIIMTSNVGSDLNRRESAIGFSTINDEDQSEKQRYEKMKDKVLQEMKRVFRPEFLNRVDTTLVFHPLSRAHIRSIVDMMLKEVDSRIQEKQVDLDVTEAARDWLGEKGYDPIFGARPLRRVIQERLEDSLSEALLRGDFEAGDTIRVDLSKELNENGVEEDMLHYERIEGLSRAEELAAEVEAAKDDSESEEEEEEGEAVATS